MLRRRLRSRLKHIGLIAVLAVSFLTGNAFAQVAESDSVVVAFANFHFKNNQLVNTYSQRLVNYFDKLDPSKPMPQDFPTKVSAPQELSQENCKESLSSACLNFELNKNFDTLLDQTKNSLQVVTVSNLSNLSGDTNNLVSQKYRFIEEQLDDSVLTIQSSLKYYQQLLLSYPMHLSYQKTQDEIDLLIENLKEIEYYIAQYPSKYNNVTTPYCK